MDFNNFKQVTKKCPFDMRWYIGKFINIDQDIMDYITTPSFLEYNLKALPQPTLIKLFIRAIYYKFKSSTFTPTGFGTGKSKHGSKHSKLNNNANSEVDSPILQFITINLDTIYYGFRNKSGVDQDTPKYTHNVNTEYYYNNTSYSLKYVPTENHNSLTNHIYVDDFARLIRRFSHLGEKTTTYYNGYKHVVKKGIATWRYKILYEFGVILKFLGNKYRKINNQLKQVKIQEKNQLLWRKQQAKQQKIQAKEQAKQQKIQEKEQAKQQKLQEKELAKQQKIRAKEQAKQQKIQEKEQAKQQKIQEKEQAKQQKLQEKELDKKERAENKMKLKQELFIMRNEDKCSHKM